MKDVELRVNVVAKFNWLDPPKTAEEESIRNSANILAASVAERFNDGLRVILLEIIETMVRR